MKASYLKPLLPLRDIVIFPSMVVPLFVGREKSIKALQEAMKSDKAIVLVSNGSFLSLVLMLAVASICILRLATSLDGIG